MTVAKKRYKKVYSHQPSLIEGIEITTAKKVEITSQARPEKKQEKKWKPKDLLQTATITPTSVHLYNRPADGFTQSKKFIENKVHLSQRKHNGELSDKAVKRIKSAIEWLLIRSKPQRVWNRQQQKVMFFRLNFITLTLPAKQCHTDKKIVARCLNNFLNIIRNKHGVTDYLWKAEAQTNGNIHFHITTNKFIHYLLVAKAWNSSIELLNYVSAFEKKHHHRNPPASQIEKVKHIRRLAAYLSKYMAKNKSFAPIGELRRINRKVTQVLYTDKVYKDEKAYGKTGEVIGTVLSGWDGKKMNALRKIESNLWGCSQSVSKCKNMVVDINSVQWDGLMKVLSEGRFYHKKSDYVNSYYGDVFKQSSKLSVGLHEDMREIANLKDLEYRFSDNKILQYM